MCLRRELSLCERRATAEVNTDRETPVYPLGYTNFTKAIFRPIKRLKLIVRWFPERSANFYLVLSRKNNGTFCSLSVSPLQYSVQTSQELDFRIIITSKNNFTEIHISRPTPLDSLSVSLPFITLSCHCHSEIMTVL